MDANSREAVRVSIVVPVFNQWHLVPELLRCLEMQTFDHDAFEVLLVDNGSEYIPPPTGEPRFVRRLVCSTPGSYAARNLGIAQARGAVVAFTDADCRPHPQWLQAALGRMQGSRMLLAGAIRIVPRDPGNPNRYEVYDMMLGMPQARYVRRGYAITANLFVPRAVLNELGGFDARRFSGGDAEFCRRARDAHIALEYVESAVVEHPARDSWAALATKVRRIKGGQLAAGPLRQKALYAVRAFLPPVRAWWRVLRASSFSWRHRIGSLFVQARLWLVEMAEVLRLLLGRRPERK